MMNQQIVKRDGRLVDFDRTKIEKAILKAFIAVDEDVSDYAIQKAKNIAEFIETQNQGIALTVEQIQDLVEKGLMNTRRKDVARAFITYRNERTLERERNSDLIKIIWKKIMASDVQNQNANVDEHSFGGRMGESNSAMMRKLALDYCMSDMARNNHLNNEIYTHDLDHYVVGDHNCFQRNTAFITNYGIRTFDSFSNGTTIKVLDMYGQWRDAIVRYYGRQPMQTVTLERCGKIKKVNCTANHRWILANGSVTENLSVGDSLLPLNDSTNYNISNTRDAEMFAFGFILGDGTDHYSDDNSRLYLNIRLCGEKIKYAPIFEAAQFRENNIKNSNDKGFNKRVYIGKQQFLTNKMWHLLSLEDKISLFNGYIAADGSTTTNTKFVWTSDERILQMICDIAPLAGYHIFDIKETINSTNFKENRLLYQITFTTSYSINSTWKVTNIKRQPNNDYEAWCVEEPVTHSFTLADGVVTGNCLTIPYDHLLKNGFNTRQTDIRPAKSVGTAFQLLAVIAQIQSLCQFGGVAASHLDWTMVPYVRMSFTKHFYDGLKYIEKLSEYKLERFLNYIKHDLHKDETIHFTDEEEIKKFHEDAWQYAMDLTVKETNQAVEGMYHNLNSLQSRSGNQLVVKRGC